MSYSTFKLSIRPLFSWIALTIFLFFSLNAHANISTVTATIDKNPAMADESIVLTVIATGDAKGNEFDPSILAGDFVVGRTSISTQTRMVNFSTTRSTTWTTMLIPRKEGTFVIPAFDVGGQNTQPITVRVIPISAASQQQAREAYVTAEVDIKAPYVQQVIRYTVKIHLAADLQRGSLAEPEFGGAAIKPLGKDTEYTEIINGQRYRIIERNYAIIPQSSGTATIKGPLFEGELLDRTRSSFSYFNQTKPINRVAPDVEITVLPAPNSFQQHWLPSEFVQINQEWQPDLNDIRVGDPITRTLTLSVLGVAQEQLPAITGVYPPSFKVYPDQPATTSVVKDKNLIAQRVENIALIPNRAGTFVLPEVKVPWFNTLTKQTEYATLAAQSIEVLPAITNATQTEPAQTTILPPENSANVDATAPATIVTIENQPPLMWQISTATFALFWLLTLGMLFKVRRQKTETRPPSITVDEVSEKQAWQSLNGCLKRDDISAINDALVTWLLLITGQQRATLDEYLYVLSDAQLTSEIKQMFASQYSKTPVQWQHKTLLTHLTRIRTEKLQLRQLNKTLKPLYT